MSLPGGWLNQDINTPVAGDTTTFSGGQWSVKGVIGAPDGFASVLEGSGGDFCQFAYQQFSGSVPITIIARLIGYPPPALNLATQGILIRTSLDPQASSAGVKFDANQQVKYGERVSFGANAGNVGGPVHNVPMWMRLEYDPATFTVTGSYSLDGVTWNVIASSLITPTPTLLVGLYGAAASSSVALFDNVTTTGAIASGTIHYTASGGFSVSQGHCKAIASVETSPGVWQLMIGDTRANEPVLVRDSTYKTFSDGTGTAYEAGFIVGSLVLAQPGEMAEVGFVTADLIKLGTSPGVGVRLDEIAGVDFTNISGFVVSDPPALYGPLTSPVSLYSNRYYLKQSLAGNATPGALCRHMQIIVDFGNTDTVQNELLSATVFGSLLVENT